MDIEVLEMAERRGSFILKDSAPAMANALRRTMLSDIPKMAIDKVDFHLGPIMLDGLEYESVTPLFDEIIAHRLGMVPVPTDYELFSPQSECVCDGEGCPSCTIMYSLNKYGPCTVLSGDMVPLGNPDLKVKDEDIPIVELTEGQAVLIYATAVMGYSRDHVKWQAAFGVGYKYLPIVEIDPDAADDPDLLEVLAVCPRGVFEERDGRLVTVNVNACSLCRACERVSNGAVSVGGDDRNFLFTFETDGSITPRQALVQATRILSTRAGELAAQTETL